MDTYTTTYTIYPSRSLKIDYEERDKIMTFPKPCDACSNNPKNGGSGICFCTVGITPITC